MFPGRRAGVEDLNERGRRNVREFMLRDERYNVDERGTFRGDRFGDVAHMMLVYAGYEHRVDLDDRAQFRDPPDTGELICDQDASSLDAAQATALVTDLGADEGENIRTVS